jgi:hypothetical protein
MAALSDFSRASPWNDLVVQRALAEIDTDVLATALVDQPDEVRSIFYRNMSRRASELVAEEIATKQGVRPSATQAAREFLVQLLEKHAKAADGEHPPASADPLPEILLDSPDSIVATFSKLASYVRKHGILRLEELESTVSHSLFRKGVGFLVDGSDPLLTRTILERYRETWLQEARTMLNMIVDGIDCIAERNHPFLVEQKLRAYLPESASKE